MIIAIDGPAGSGKTTIAKRLAKKLNVLYLDTGATYRALTHKALIEKINLTDEAALSSLAKRLDLTMKEGKVFLENTDITEEIRRPTIDKNISKPVALAAVRRAMVALQRNIVNNSDAVVEGRDITTVVFPNAQYKFYLDAQLKTRAGRRFKELAARGIEVVFDELERDMKKRDNADLKRKVGPLQKAEDAIYVDTSDLTIDEVIAKLISCIEQRRYEQK